MTLLPLEVTCFGPPKLVVRGDTPGSSLKWRKNVGLIVYLALGENKTRARTRLRGMLWPDKPEQDARHSLNGAISQLRTELGEERLVTEGDMLRLNDRELRVDVFEFEQAITRDPLAAAGIPRGEFLEGLTIDDAPEFDDWIESQRDRLHRAWAGTLLAKGEVALAENRFKSAFDDAARVLELLPYSEPAAQLQTRVALLQGDGAEAKRLFLKFEAKLREVTEHPSSEFRRWVDDLESHTTVRAHPGRTPNDPPLVGRAQEHKAAFTSVTRAIGGGPYMLVLQGDPGMGKSRLAFETAQRFSVSGGHVYWARPVESDRDTPWSTLRTLMREGLAEAPGLAATDPDALGCLAAIVPDLSKRFAHVQPTDRAQVGTALARYLRAVSTEQPIALVIDEAEYADEPTLEALRAAVADLLGARVLIIVTTSVRAVGAPIELARMRADIARTVPGVLVHLRALGVSDMTTLVDHYAAWCDSPEHRKRLTKRLVSDVDGNPFLAITFLQGLAESPTLKHDLLSWPRPNETLESALPMTLPDLLRVAVTARLSNLDKPGIEVMRAASIGTPTIDVALTAHLTGYGEDKVLDQLDQLEQHHFVSYRDPRYVFRAPLVQEVVRDECITAGRRRRMRTHAIEFLKARPDISSKVLRLELLMKIDPTSSNAQCAMDLAEEALAEHQVSLARRAVSAAHPARNDPDVADRLVRLRTLLSKARRTPAPV
jgi:DNA-binding SARP family transcriptional activator